jgi:hypothetical protein
VCPLFLLRPALLFQSPSTTPGQEDFLADAPAYDLHRKQIKMLKPKMWAFLLGHFLFGTQLWVSLPTKNGASIKRGYLHDNWGVCYK